jgi:hypothetical protein
MPPKIFLSPVLSLYQDKIYEQSNTDLTSEVIDTWSTVGQRYSLVFRYCSKLCSHSEAIILVIKFYGVRLHLQVYNPHVVSSICFCYYTISAL